MHHFVREAAPRHWSGFCVSTGKFVEAHISIIWALLIICGCVVVKLATAILQTKCMAENRRFSVIGDQLSVISAENVDLEVAHG